MQGLVLLIPKRTQYIKHVDFRLALYKDQYRLVESQFCTQVHYLVVFAYLKLSKIDSFQE